MSIPIKTAVAALALALALSLAACGGDSDEEPTGGSTGATAPQKSQAPPVPMIVIRNGEPVGGVRELEYSAGEDVRFRVRSDVADEVHVHGYDLMKDVPAGGSVQFSFQADIEGIFEVELEDRGEQIAELRVTP